MFSSLTIDSFVWEKLNTSGQLLPPRAGHTSVVLGKNLFVFGGFWDEENVFDDVHMLDVGTGQYIHALLDFCPYILPLPFFLHLKLFPLKFLICIFEQKDCYFLVFTLISE